jgi:rod shape-determining protein MreB
MLFSKTQDLAIDLGNTNTLLRDQTHLLLSEPSVIVVDSNTQKVEAVGEQAYQMFEKTHSYLHSIRPLHGGVISDGASAKKMVWEMVAKISRPSMLRRFNYLVSGVPLDTTAVEQRALRDTLDQFSARQTHLVYEPIAAAIGMGLNIQEPEGKLIVDIGGGITEIVVISLSGVAVSTSVRTAGDVLDEEIQHYFRREHHLAIGLKTAEFVKRQLGCFFQPLASAKQGLHVKGKDLREGIPTTRWINEVDLCRVLERPFGLILNCIQQTLEICPPELAGDIYKNGLFITGGHAKLKGLAERLHKTFQLPVHIDQQPLLSVSNGIAQILKKPDHFRSVLM